MPLQRDFGRIQTVITVLLLTVVVLWGAVALWFISTVFSQSSAVPPPNLPYPTVQLSLDLTVVAIDAEIAQADRQTQVSVRTIGSPLEEIEFQLSVTEFDAIERAIAKELNLAPSVIHSLIRYRLN
jgi:hypothetical protein